MTATEAPEQMFSVDVPLPKVLTISEELAIAQRAAELNPGSAAIRERLASLLLRRDRFDEVLQLWQEQTDATVPSRVATTVLAHLGKDDAAHDRQAGTMLDHLLAGELQLEYRAAALTLRGKVYDRAGDLEAALALHKEALRLYPESPDAYKRIVSVLLRQGRAEQVLDLAAEMIARGVRNPRVLASKALAYATLGRMEEAHAAEGSAELLRSYKPLPPEGWDSLEGFATDLAAELNAHPDIQFEKYGAASSRTWRIDEPALRRSRVFPALQALVVREVAAYVRSIRPLTHPFVEAMPAPASLRMWCVITEEDGHEIWHVHQNGWLSGTFYVAIPEHIAKGTDKAGCIAFGLPEDVVGDDAAEQFGLTLLRPQVGLMTVFPSHTFHRTFQHGGTGRRICCAFDVIQRPS